MTTRESKSDKPPRRTRASSTLRTQVKSLLADGGTEKAAVAILAATAEVVKSLLADGGTEKEPIGLTELQSKLEELMRSDPQEAEQVRIALESFFKLEEHTPPDRRRSTLELTTDVLENSGEWLRTSNTQLGNRRPIDLMGTDEEEKVFDLLHAVDQGLF